jgi:tRNA modification GTPase
MTTDADTIAAIATPPGRGAIAVVRVSGPGAFEVAARVLAPWPLAPRAATLCVARDPRTGERVERPLVTAFPAPRSYTGEDVVELSTHGGLTAPAAVLAALVSAGAREALPGEFTRRAVLHGKMDLAQAEAVGDLIDARTQALRRVALAQLDGGLSRRVAVLRERVLDVEALVAYDIDFPEEDDGPVPRARVEEAARAARDAVDALARTAPAGELVRDGALVVIAGPPNAGKSSLLNALAGEARAIVTDVPGTTRDAIEALLDVPDAPWPLRLVDTAGLRESTDAVERLGIELSERWVARAHVVLACGETPDDVARTAARVAALTDAPALGVWTKRDAMPNDVGHDGALVGVSAVTGEGLGALVRRLVDAVAERHGAPDAGATLVTRARHRRALDEASAELSHFLGAWRDDALPAPVAAVHLRAAAGALEEIIGAVDVEDVLTRLFSTFCVGK